jgi:hypothetical protein
MLMRVRSGQTITEAALFFLAVVLALVAMTGYVRRSAQANLKTLEDHINAEAKTPGQT